MKEQMNFPHFTIRLFENLRRCLLLLAVVSGTAAT